MLPSDDKELKINVQKYWYKKIEDLAQKENVPVEQMAVRLIIQSLYFRLCIDIPEPVIRRVYKREQSENCTDDCTDDSES